MNKKPREESRGRKRKDRRESLRGLERKRGEKTVGAGAISEDVSEGDCCGGAKPWLFVESNLVLLIEDQEEKEPKSPQSIITCESSPRERAVSCPFPSPFFFF